MKIFLLLFIFKLKTHPKRWSWFHIWPKQNRLLWKYICQIDLKIKLALTLWKSLLFSQEPGSTSRKNTSLLENLRRLVLYVLSIHACFMEAWKSFWLLLNFSHPGVAFLRCQVGGTSSRSGGCWSWFSGPAMHKSTASEWRQNTHPVISTRQGIWNPSRPGQIPSPPSAPSGGYETGTRWAMKRRGRKYSSAALSPEMLLFKTSFSSLSASLHGNPVHSSLSCSTRKSHASVRYRHR